MVLVSFHTEGGLAHFPGLAVEKTIDTDDLPTDQASLLIALLASVSGQPDQDAPPGAADFQTWTVTVHDGEDVRQFRLIDMTEAEPARQLLEFLRVLR